MVSDSGHSVIKVSSPDSSDSKEATPADTKSVKVTQNGEVTDSQPKSDVTSSTPQENGEVIYNISFFLF